ADRPARPGRVSRRSAKPARCRRTGFSWRGLQFLHSASSRPEAPLWSGRPFLRRRRRAGVATELENHSSVRRIGRSWFPALVRSGRSLCEEAVQAVLVRTGRRRSAQRAPLLALMLRWRLTHAFDNSRVGDGQDGLFDSLKLNLVKPVVAKIEPVAEDAS